MKITVDITPEEFQELFVPGDKQSDFAVKVYDAYAQVFTEIAKGQIDPYNMFGWKNDDNRK